MQPKPMTREQIGSVAKTAIDDARDFIRSEIADERIKAQRYFDGETDLGHEEGRSKVVATKCRDTVRAVKPSLLRVFMQADKPVEFVPQSQEDVQAAEQATEFAKWKFSQQHGFSKLHDAIHDALVKKTGILKVYHAEYDDVEVDEYTGLSDEAFALIASDDEIEVLEHSAEVVVEVDPMGMEVEVSTHDVKVARTKTNGKICIESVPPEDFFVDRNATTIEDAYVCGHSAVMRVGDLVEMGFDFEEVATLDAGDEDTSEDEEQFERRDYSDNDEDENAIDPSMKKVLVTEAYMKMDVEGTGVPRLYQVICGGSGHKLLSYELADEVPFAVFEIDPEPHTFFGRSLVDIVIDDQDAATAMLRGLLDNIALMNTPYTAVVEDMVNMDDFLNNEIGAIRRVKDMGAFQEMAVQPTATAVLPGIQYYDEVIEGKTGVSRASMGLNPDALQSSTAAAVNATVQGANGQMEVMARHIAEGGLKQLFRLLVKLAAQHPDQNAMMRLNGTFQVIDPRSWNTEMDLTINVGLGVSQQQERVMALREAFQTQSAIWGNYGPQNGIVTLTQIRNTLADLLSLQGVKNVDRYYAPMDPQREQMMMMQMQAQEGEQQPDPYLQAEMIKAQQKAQADQAKHQRELQKDTLNHQREMVKLAAEDDRKRDEMDQELLVAAAKILGEYGVAVDTAQIKAMQAAPREFGG